LAVKEVLIGVQPQAAISRSGRDGAALLLTEPEMITGILLVICIGLVGLVNMAILTDPRFDQLLDSAAPLPSNEENGTVFTSACTRPCAKSGIFGLEVRSASVDGFPLIGLMRTGSKLKSERFESSYFNSRMSSPKLD
jgi:hypothetical protein